MKIPKADSGITSLFQELTPTDTAVTSKKMFGQPAAFAHGNLFMGVFGESMFVRLSEPDRIEAKAKGEFVPFEPMPGRPMREYWVFPRSMIEDPVEARRWVSRSLKYALSLPPKRAKTGSK